MICETLALPMGARMTVYAPDALSEVDAGQTFPCVALCPGGAYAFVSGREGEPVALKFLAEGIACAVITYQCHPQAHYPAQLLQVCEAMDTLRNRAGEWHIQPDNIFVMGFSAGGHLAASVGNGWNSAVVRERIPDPVRPRGMILCYPVITAGEFAHRGSFENLLGDGYTYAAAQGHSMEKRVNGDTPPAFLWHTFEDSGVPVENSLLMASALRRQGIPFELHVYPRGEHGLSLCDEYVGSPMPHNATWMGLCAQWVKETCR